MTPRDIKGKFAIDCVSKLFRQQFVGVISKIQLIGKESVDGTLVRFTNVIFDFPPRIESGNDFSSPIDRQSYRARYLPIQGKKFFGNIAFIHAIKLSPAVPA